MGAKQGNTKRTITDAASGLGARLRATYGSADLLDGLSYWRRRALRVNTDIEADFVEWFGGHVGEARLLASLYEAKGNPVATADLARAGGLSKVSVRIYVRYLRQILGADAIRALVASYELTPAGMAECATALEQIKVQRLRLGLPRSAA